MAYVDIDYRTKKEFLTALRDGVVFYPYNPSGMFAEPQNGNIVVEGPHFPKPHRWYAQCVVRGGTIISAK